MTWIVFALGLFAGMYTGGMFVRFKYAVKVANVIQSNEKAMMMIEKRRYNQDFENRVEEEVRRRLERLVGEVVNETKPH